MALSVLLPRGHGQMRVHDPAECCYGVEQATIKVYPTVGHVNDYPARFQGILHYMQQADGFSGATRHIRGVLFSCEAYPL